MSLPPVISIDVPCVTGGPLHVPDAAALAEVFFSTEISSLGPRSYEARTLTTHPDRLDREDITILNGSFRAMIIKVSLWEPLLAAGDLPWLATLDREWDVITMSEAELADHRVLDRVSGR